MNIWLKSLYFLFIVLTAVHLQYRIKKNFRKYYLVDVTYEGRVYDDDHRFSMMMTREEFVKAYPWNIRHANHGTIDMGDYGFVELDLKMEVTKDEYERFRGKLDSVCSEELLKGFRYPEELKEDDQEEWQRETKDIKEGYYLAQTWFRPGGETVYGEYTFQMMLKDEELEAWQKYKPWRPTVNTEDEYYNYEKDYPYVRVVCEVTKHEYKKFNKHLKGFIKSQVMYKIQEVLG